MRCARVVAFRRTDPDAAAAAAAATGGQTRLWPASALTVGRPQAAQNLWRLFQSTMARAWA